MKHPQITFDTCRSCGRPLADPEQEFCAACRSMEAAKERYLKKEHTVRTRRRRMNPVTRRMLIAVCVLAAIFLGMCAAATVLYSRYSPDQFLAAWDAALADGDARAVKRMLRGGDLAVSDEGAAALCRAFADDARRAALCGQLAAQVVDEAAQGDFPALRLKKEPVFLGYGTYCVEVRGVQLLLHSSARNLILALDGVPRTGDAVAEGVLYQNLFPGQYACTVTGVTAIGQPVTGSATELLLFSDTAPTVFDGALPVAEVTVSGCVSDEAVITVDGLEMDARPVNGVASLPQIAVGSVIGMRYTAPWGAVTTDQVAFTDPSDAALAFAAPVTEGGVPSPEELATLLTIHCATYFDALNQQDAALISGCTDACREALAAEVGLDFNREHLFIMGNIECLPMVKSTPGEASPVVSCAARMNYTCVDRASGGEVEAARFFACAFVWADGWQLSARADITEEAYLATTLETLP